MPNERNMVENGSRSRNTKKWTFLVVYAVVIRFSLFFIHLLCGVVDLSTDAFKGIEETEGIGRVLAGFHRWDAIHFVHIAQKGYSFENNLAFYPLYPLLLRSFSWFFIGFSPKNAIICSGIVLNMIFFMISAVMCYLIALTIFKSEKRAICAYFLFIINPASVFFSSIYTESFYSTLTFCGIYCTITGQNVVKYGFSLAFFLLSFGVRSNGFLNIGYLLFYLSLKLIFVEEKTKKGVIRRLKPFKSLIIQGLYILILISLLFIMFGIFSHFNHSAVVREFCDTESFDASLHKIASELGVPSKGDVNNINWCSDDFCFFPPFYKVIQEKYWNVGLFQYWKLSKIPCFILGLPMVILVFWGLVRVVKKIINYGLFHMLANGGHLIPFAIHSTLLATMGLFFYNVEVTTRMICSSSPFIYLFLAEWIDLQTPKAFPSDLLRVRSLFYFQQKGTIPSLVILYFISFAFIGTIAHAMFLPFT